VEWTARTEPAEPPPHPTFHLAVLEIP
jgi:hypothetical protein